MKHFFLIVLFLLAGCVATPPVQTPPPEWNSVNETYESEYIPYLGTGTGEITGQAFLTQRGGVVVKAAGRNVTIDPATSVGNEWWAKAGIIWQFKSLTPPSPNFHKARKTTVADADGRFKFSNIPDGEYYVRTEVTWLAGTIQGGLVGSKVTVKNGMPTEVILNQFAK
jgi:hypothetical protein